MHLYWQCICKMLTDPNIPATVTASVAMIAFNDLHPFYDGNGRFQRILFNLILSNKNEVLSQLCIPISKYLNQHKDEYIDLLDQHAQQYMSSIYLKVSKNYDTQDDVCPVEFATQCNPLLWCYLDYSMQVEYLNQVVEKSIEYLSQQFDSFDKYLNDLKMVKQWAWHQRDDHFIVEYLSNVNHDEESMENLKTWIHKLEQTHKIPQLSLKRLQLLLENNKQRYF